MSFAIKNYNLPIQLLTPSLIYGNAITVPYTANLTLSVDSFNMANVISITGIPDTNPTINFPTSSQLAVLFTNKTNYTIKTFILINDAQATFPNPAGGADHVVSAGMNLLTMELKSASTPTINIQLLPVGSNSPPAPIALELAMTSDETLSAFYTYPQMNSLGTEVTLTNASEPRDLTLDTASNYHYIFSAAPPLPISYSFIINNNSGQTITLLGTTGGSNLVTITYVNGSPTVENSADLVDDAVYEITFHFNSTGTSAKCGVARLA